jgi:F0F1-type ATP synthase assembly protein I
MTDEEPVRRRVDRPDPRPAPQEEDPLQCRARELGEGGGLALPDLPEPPSKQEIDARLAPARTRLEESARAAREPPGEDTAETYRSTGVGLTIAYLVIGAPIGGWLAGLLIDRWLGGTTWQAALGLGGAFAGVALAIRLLKRENLRP